MDFVRVFGRATFDLDLVTVRAAQEPLVELLAGLGYETLHVSPGYSSHQHADPDWGGVDLIYVDPDAPTAASRSACRSPRGNQSGTDGRTSARALGTGSSGG